MPTLPQQDRQLQANYVAANFNHHLQQIKNKFKNFPPLQVLHKDKLSSHHANGTEVYTTRIILF